MGLFFDSISRCSQTATMNRHALHDILSRYVSNQSTAEECRLVEHWYELIGEPTDIPLTEKQWKALERKIWKRLQPTSVEAPSVGWSRPLWRQVAMAASGMAAVVAVVIGVNWYQTKKTAASDLLVGVTEQAAWTEHDNTGNQPQTVNLSDGSRVTLEPNAKIAVSNGFNRLNRELRLIGEAAFDVRRNPGMPFIVYSGDMVTKVLGTRFVIRAPQRGKPMEVIVKTGKVTVFRRSFNEEKVATLSNTGVILTPNQKATYFPETHQFVASLADNPQLVRVIPSKEGIKPFVFADTPVSDVLYQLEEAYGVEIDLEQETLATCTFTGNLTQQSLYTKLELISGAINGTFEVRGTKILIAGKGCN